MNKGRGAPPSRGIRSPTAARPPKRPAFDPLRVAAEIVATLADAVVVTGVDRRGVSPHPPPAGPVRRPPPHPPPAAADRPLVSTPRAPAAAGGHRRGPGPRAPEAN